MGRVPTPGGDLLDDLLDGLLTPCAGTLRTVAFTIYKTGNLTQPSGYTMVRWFLVGRDNIVV